ncbi:MAG: hypothetical protein ACI92G_002716 [Candidatus Pelagisphaera sp.]|jgi:hypothetical protein
MNLLRRSFLKKTLAASATGMLASRLSAAPAGPAQEFYELRCYHLKADSRIKADANPALLDDYLEHAFLPALRKLGVKNTGIFTEIEVDKKTGSRAPKRDSPVWVLMTHRSLDSYVEVTAALNADPAVLKAGADYLKVPKAAPAFERIDSWLMRAFAGMPRLNVPAFSKKGIPTRVFEMRDYESHSEERALAKMDMFNAGEIEVMEEIGINPVMFAQALSGPNLPHLRYITSGPDIESHLAGWKKFGPHPIWQKLRKDPRYADSTSRNTSRFLTPKSYSEL